MTDREHWAAYQRLPRGASKPKPVDRSDRESPEREELKRQYEQKPKA